MCEAVELYHGAVLPCPVCDPDPKLYMPHGFITFPTTESGETGMWLICRQCSRKQLEDGRVKFIDDADYKARVADAVKGS
jgi:hypothetical protein